MASFFAVSVPNVASAESACDAIVVDGANVLGNHQSVETAALKLNGIGADVRVRTLPNLGNFATVDDYMAATVKACPTWQGINNDRKSNLVVYVMTKEDRKLGVFYGDGWTNAFSKGGGEQRIWADFMVPRFKSGDYPGGFVAAIDETYRVFDSYLHPSQNAPSSQVVVQEKPTDYSGLWKVLGFGLAALVLIVLLLLGYFALRRRKEANERLKTMRQRALSARDATSRITDVVGDTAQVAVRLVKVDKYSKVGKDEALQLAELKSEVESEYETAVNGMASAASDSATADDHGLSEGEYEQLAERYEAALVHAQAAQEADQKIDELASDIESQLQQVPKGIASAQAELDQLTAKVQSLKEERIEVGDIDDFLVTAGAALEDAKAKSAELEALKHLQKANDSLKQAREADSILDQKRQQLKSGIPELQARITAVVATADDARKCFERITATYADPNWESVKGNGTEAEKRIHAATASLDTAIKLSDVSNQQWDNAIAALQEGNMLLDKAVSLLSSITKLEGHLKDAKEHAMQEADAVQADIARVTSYIATYDDDIREEHENAVREAQSQLDQAKQLLGESKPDYLHAVDQIGDAQAAIDHIYHDAVDEHEAAERLRQQAAAALQKAKAAISKAHEFIEDHDSDVGSSAESELRTARQRLANSNQKGDAAGILEVANSAIRSAEDAYQSAKSDFDSAESDRRRVREAEEARQRRARESSYSSSYSSSSSSSSFGGGSSGSWGSSFGGGGSSGSFGGGGGGGGSSGSW